METEPDANCFLARQPIFDARQKVRGYEILFRSGASADRYDGTDPEASTGRLITNALFVLGLERITGGKKAYLNAPRGALLSGVLAGLPPTNTVIEILETVPPDPPVVAACDALWRAGHTLALDDFDDEPKWAPLLPYADIIKVDVLATKPESLRGVAQRHARCGRRLLAEKVETHEMFASCRDAGFSLFQGFFFSKPMLLTAHDIPPFKIHQLQLFQEMYKKELDYGRIEEILKRDVSLSMRLLRYINSAHFGMRHAVSSIRQALALLGEIEIHRWASLLALIQLADDRPDHLLIEALTRARFCELLAGRMASHVKPSRAFLLGLFSFLDGILSRPMTDILSEIAVGEDIRKAILSGEGEMHRILQLAKEYERGEWDGFNSEEALATSRMYVDSVVWAESAYRETSEL